MAEASVVDKLKVCLGQEYRVKLGKSFTFPKENAFHAIKYDFKPLSVDAIRPGRLKVSEDEVNVSLPVGQGELAEDFAQFRGNKKPCTKECVLIINTNTGEAILEKIGNTVNLKAIRDGRKSVLLKERSISPSPYPSHMTQSKTQLPLKSQLATSSAIANNTPTLSTTSTPQATTTPATAAGKASTSSSGKMKGAKRHNKKTPKNTSLSSLSSTKQQDGRASKSTSSVGSKSKRNTKKVKTEAHNNKSSISSSAASSSLSSTVSNSHVNSSNLLNIPAHTHTVTTAAAPSMPSFSELAPPPREISPIHSNNPTPEPTLAPPPSKKPKVDLPSSSSSSSDSSDDEGAELPLKAPPTHLLPQHQQPGNVHHRHHQHGMQMSHMTQKVAHKAGQSHMTHMPNLIGQQPHLHHQHQQQRQQQQQQQQQQQLQQQQQQQQQQQLQLQLQQQPQQLSSSVINVQSSSSSDSDSGSSSGSSSSDSSSDSSDQENDREVALYTRQPPPNRQMSMSQLRTDLQLSDSGSDSD